ncbi:MAG: hypothetical protein JKY22_11605 [Flavobacteriaceae bacterium]|nr:hypothetical protein [Flavobacteriaceae bacterium]
MKIIIIALFCLFSINSWSQSEEKDYSKYEKAKNDQVKYISEKAYWDEFVRQTNKLYRITKKVKKTTDVIITSVTRFTPNGKKVRLFYKGGKLIGKKVGKEAFVHFMDYETKKKRKKRKKSH